MKKIIKYYCLFLLYKANILIKNMKNCLFSKDLTFINYVFFLIIYNLTIYKIFKNC